MIFAKFTNLHFSVLLRDDFKPRGPREKEEGEERDARFFSTRVELAEPARNIFIASYIVNYLLKIIYFFISTFSTSKAEEELLLHFVYWL